ncbi:hypothetical protein TrLO_g11394 [Triparma laevis f. longispina]|nr:hypothetical protein TrLO_g11394 [Triparma laevis f. longispina]
MVIISIPTIFDPTLAPEGYHVLHAYTAASEDFGDWEEFLKYDLEKEDGEFEGNCYKRDYEDMEGYKKLKEDKSQVLFDAVERIFPDIRSRLNSPENLISIGTPLTHRRFNRRGFGAYGPGVDSDSDTWKLLQTKALGIENLYMCGDCCFPGIGIPGVSASGCIAANTVVGVREHGREVKRGRKMGILQ